MDGQIRTVFIYDINYNFINRFTYMANRTVLYVNINVIEFYIINLERTKNVYIRNRK